MIGIVRDIGRGGGSRTRLLALPALVAGLVFALVLASTASGNPSARTAKDRIKIAVVLHLRVPSLLQFGYGAQQAGKEFGFDVDVEGLRRSTRFSSSRS